MIRFKEASIFTIWKMPYIVNSVLIISSALFLPACESKDSENINYKEWRVYKGDPGSNSYSELDQINKNNVHKLQVAWTFNSGDKDNIKWRSSTSECNPIIIDGIMYLTSPALKVMAINAATGEFIWSYDPFHGEKAVGVNRGVAYWENGDDKRIFSSAGFELFALDAETGSLITDFGNNGIIDLRNGLDRDPEDLYVVASSPGIVYKDLLIMGSSVGESDGAAPGHIRAYDVKTGEISWIFHTIPYPDEVGYDTWEDKDAWKTQGGANAWGGLSIDEERGWVFVPTGSPSSDFYGGNRKGQNLFGNSVIALNAETGERIWHYQLVHHDLWDYDLPCPPNLVTVNHDGKKIDAVAQVTKQGLLFLLDRETGKPLFPVEERPVAVSPVAGEASWPTQPVPVKPPPFTRIRITEKDLTDISPEAHAFALEQFKKLRNEGLFTPASEQETLFFPGTQGGAVWGGAAFDPATGLLFINANELPYFFSLKPVKAEPKKNQQLVVSGENLYQINCASCHGSERKGTANLFPSLVNIKDKLSRTEIGEIIKKGQGSMPGFPQFSQEENEAVINFLLDIKDKAVLTDSAGMLEMENIEIKYRFTHNGYNQFNDEEGYPAVKPPWGTLNAINLNTGEIAWKVPLGEHAELIERGIPPTGTRSLGGPVVTAGGLVFIGGSQDEKFRAFDKETGEILWETKLPAGGYATPAVYEVNGKQYIVIAATGGGRMGTPTSDAFIAFALPDEE